MNRQTDTFWKNFWIIAGGLTVCAVGAAIITLYIRFAFISEAAMNVVSDTSRDPFEHPLTVSRRPVSDFLYRDFLPEEFEDWSWGSKVDWRASDAFEGSHAVRVQFTGAWGGIRIHTPNILLEPYASISLAIRPDDAPRDLYIEMYDAYGRTSGRQSLAWYAPEHALTPNAWQTVTIPIRNLVSENTREISGLSIMTDEALGTASLDMIHLEKASFTHERWEEPVFVPEETPTDLFENAPPAPLPYRLAGNFETNVSAWKSLFGLLEGTATGMRTGPVEQKTTGSMIIFKGGREWRDYRVRSTVDWGLTSVYSLLVRFADDRNFASCAFQNYGASVQIYSVSDGESTLLGQTPILPTPDYQPWVGTKLGAEASGSRVSCLIDGERVLSADMDALPEKGTVGIETWDRTSYSSPHTVREMEVTPL